MSEPRPLCPECGEILHPCQPIVVVANGGTYPTDAIPAGMSYPTRRPDVFAGLYCSCDCVLDAVNRGWPEWRDLIS